MKPNESRGAGWRWLGLPAALLLLAACSPRNGGYRTVKVAKGPFNLVVQAPGQLRSTASHYVGCPTVERMWRFTIAFMAPEGKAVRAGDPILSFDSQELTERLQVKMTELTTEKKELERLTLAEQESRAEMALQLEEEKVGAGKAERKAMVPEEFTAANEVRKLKMDLELARFKERLARTRLANQDSGMKTRIRFQQTKVKALQDQVDQLQADIAKLEVKAPKAGMVVYTSDWDGKKKNVGDPCWMGETILELPDLSRMQMEAVVLEPQAGKIRAGQAAEIRLDSNPDRVFKARVTSLGRIFRVKSDAQPVVVFDALLDMPESDPGLMRPGMTATARIFVSTRENVLQIPEAALVYGEKGLMVRRRGLFSERLAPVRIGGRSGGMAEVVGGLAENDEVLIRTEAKEDER